MLNAWIVFQRMLVLSALMLIGYFSYKKGILEKISYSHLSRLVISIMNPLLIIDGVLGKESTPGNGLRQNLFFTILYFVILILLSFPVVGILRVKKSEGYLYRLMLIFSNVGFMGIPVITSLYGENCVLYIAFYILAYNLLLYTYGLILVNKSVAHDENSSKRLLHKEDSSPKKGIALFINPGVIACVIAIAVFAFRIPVPDPAMQLIHSLGNCAVPLSMILIGASMAQQKFKSLLTDPKMYLYLAIRMLVIPLAAAFVLRHFSFDRQVIGVFGMMLAMPIGSIVVLLANGQGADETLCTRGSVISTLASVITIPLIAAFLP